MAKCVEVNCGRLRFTLDSGTQNLASPHVDFFNGILFASRIDIDIDINNGRYSYTIRLKNGDTVTYQTNQKPELREYEDQSENLILPEFSKLAFDPGS